MKYKLDNGEILECDTVYCTTVSCVPKYILKTHPTRLSRDYIKGCTLALSTGYFHVRTITYLVDDKRCHKHIPIRNPLYSTSTESWIRTHLLYE